MLCALHYYHPAGSQCHKIQAAELRSNDTSIVCDTKVSQCDCHDMPVRTAVHVVVLRSDAFKLAAIQKSPTDVAAVFRSNPCFRVFLLNEFAECFCLNQLVFLAHTFFCGMGKHQTQIQQYMKIQKQSSYYNENARTFERRAMILKVYA